MWQLMMTNAAKEWVDVGDFETVTAVAGRIRELEGYPVTGVFFKVYVAIQFTALTRKRSGIFTTTAVARFMASSAVGRIES
jgi:hypothetical protein